MAAEARPWTDVLAEVAVSIRQAVTAMPGGWAMTDDQALQAATTAFSPFRAEVREETIRWCVQKLREEASRQSNDLRETRSPEDVFFTEAADLLASELVGACTDCGVPHWAVPRGHAPDCSVLASELGEGDGDE
jgi:hypothetical protein